MEAGEAASHGFAAYNKGSSVPTLVGNWVEERSLKDGTGTARYEPWVSTAPQQTIYAPRQDNASEMPTHPRVVEHVHAAQDPQNWRSMYDASYRHPTTAPQLLEYKNTQGLGPRAKMELEAMRDAVASSMGGDEPSTITSMAHPATLDTTYSASYVPQDLTANTIGARAMRDHDGRPKVHDPTFLAETQLVPRALGDRLFGETAQLAGATQTLMLPHPDIPITIYSEAVANRTYGGNIAGTRPIACTQPFNKFTNFSKPMSEYNKVVIDE